MLNKLFKTPLKMVLPSRILVDVAGERNMLSYGNLKDALENRLNLSPSPVEISLEIKSGFFLKPVRLIKLREKNGNFEYKLVSGRVRYWAWIIAFGNSKPIPAYVRHDLTN